MTSTKITLFATLLNEGSKINFSEAFTPPGPQALPTTQQQTNNGMPQAATQTAASNNTATIDSLVDALNGIRSAKSFNDPATYNAIADVWGKTSPAIQKTVLDVLNQIKESTAKVLDNNKTPTQQTNGTPMPPPPANNSQATVQTNQTQPAAV